MKKYNDIVVGSGISGLSLTLLLALQGRRVLLIEKAPTIGGSMSRFYKQGVPFDTGFHFTGGFGKNGLLTSMLQVLGIREAVKPILLKDNKANRYIFEKEGLEFDVPAGINNFKDALKKRFLQESAGIDRFFARMQTVCDKTSTMDLSQISMSPEVTEDDFVSLQSVLDALITDEMLKSVLSVYTLCYGTGPRDISFANHARAALSLYECTAMVEDGGDSFIHAFKNSFKDLDIDIKCNCQLAECRDIENDCAKSFILNTGERIEADCCSFTIHPQKVLELLPKEYLSKAFVERVSAFEPSVGFFSLFGVVDGVDDFDTAMATIFPDKDINALFNNTYNGIPALAVAKKQENLNGKKFNVVNTFAMNHYEQVSAWADSKLRNRPADYYEYKQKTAESITARFKKYYPEYKNNFRVLDSSSMLTFRDYLYSPDGCAYGIKQKLGQYNLFGKLPIRNLYAGGQSGVLPGIVGAMLSSFVLARSIVGKDGYAGFIASRL